MFIGSMVELTGLLLPNYWIANIGSPMAHILHPLLSYFVSYVVVDIAYQLEVEMPII